MLFLVALIAIFLPFVSQAQEEPSVEKSIFSIQAGASTTGIWVNNESKLSNTIALRSEIGFEITRQDVSIGDSLWRHKNSFPLVLVIEPRWYFETKRLYAKGLRYDNNAGMYLSLKIKYHAGWFVLAGEQPSDIEIIPMIAGRYHIGKRFNYEIGGGMGYKHTFNSDDKNRSVWAFDVILRIGYTF